MRLPFLAFGEPGPEDRTLGSAGPARAKKAQRGRERGAGGFQKGVLSGEGGALELGPEDQLVR